MEDWISSVAKSAFGTPFCPFLLYRALHEFSRNPGVPAHFSRGPLFYRMFGHVLLD
jgi:hypothetical protein